MTNKKIEQFIRFFGRYHKGQAFALAFFVEKQKRAQTIALSLTRSALLKK